MALKVLEGTIRTVLDEFREEMMKSKRGKVGGLMIRPAARGLRRRLDPDTYGGGYPLGLKGLAVVAHGNSSQNAIVSAVQLGARGVRGRVVERMTERLSSRARVRQSA
jgi:glycerol-3-phosphate acyltransferase PlsX